MGGRGELGKHPKFVFKFTCGARNFCIVNLDSQMHSQEPENNKLLQKTWSLDSLEHSGEGDMPLQKILVIISDSL